MCLDTYHTGSNPVIPTVIIRRNMNEKLRPYLFRQTAYTEISKNTGIPEDECRQQLEHANRILNPSGNLILYPERLPWHLID